MKLKNIIIGILIAVAFIGCGTNEKKVEGPIRKLEGSVITE